ncbi:hypothetical protein BX600DRAFT_474828 [Xylariales sp. PMI_506]|nr:hypothetical protein BX600DRAFT_474828 [Xylariales sp. PMI_506]
MAATNFRVIIAGGSVAGLVLANALEAAGIDFVVLEKREIAPDLGASISLLYNAAGPFMQLGLWPRLRELTVPLLHLQRMDEQGRQFEVSNMFRGVAETTGRPILFVRRRQYIEVLYDNLKDKSKVKSRCGVESYVETDEGVTVITTTGERIVGSMLVGADGTHSTVRGLMAQEVAQSDPRRAKELTECFTSRYNVIFGTSPTHAPGDPSKSVQIDGLVQSVMYRGVAGTYATGMKGTAFWFIFMRSDKPTTTPNVPKYTDKDAQAMVDKIGNRFMGPGFTFREVWDVREKAGMTAMEEGTVPGRWDNGGRVVLIGDSVSKCTINVGLGGNTHVEAATHLTNFLKDLLDRSPTPSTADLQLVFAKYEKAHRPRAEQCVSFSIMVTQFDVMETWWLRLIRVISPWVSDSLKARGFIGLLQGAPVLNFLPQPGKGDWTGE